MRHDRSALGRSPQSSNMRASPLSTVLLVASLVLLCLLGIVREAKSSSEDYVAPADPDHGPFDCMRLMLRGAKVIVKKLSPCGKEVKAQSANNKEYAEKMGCVMKCVMKKAGILNEAETITDETLHSLISRFSPSTFLTEEIYEYMRTNCGKFVAKLDPKEDKCLTYADYTTCMQASFEGFMNTSPYCIKKKKKEER